MLSLIEHSKTLDPTRLLSAALERHEKEGDPATQVLNDKIGNYLDIVAFNEYIGWYGGRPDDAPKARWGIGFNKPVVVSEFGAGALQGLHGSRDERWTEEYQEYLYQQTLLMLENIPTSVVSVPGYWPIFARQNGYFPAFRTAGTARA